MVKGFGHFINGAGVSGDSGPTGRTRARRVNAGMVGGWKRSGFGDANRRGPEGVRFRTRIKTIAQRWPDDVQGSEFVNLTMR